MGKNHERSDEIGDKRFATDAVGMFVDSVDNSLSDAGRNGAKRPHGQRED